MLTAKEIPFFMTQATAAALLRESRARRVKALAQRELSAQLRRLGWSDTAAAELATIHIQLQERGLK